MKPKKPAKPIKLDKNATLAVEMWPIDKPLGYPKNARKLSDKAVAKCAASIQAFGWRQPIVVDNKGVIIAGHTRLLAAQQLGLKEVPVHVADNLTAAQVRAYRLADNRTAQETSWDLELLGPELLELQALDLDLSLTGFDADELKMFMSPGVDGLTDPDDCPAPQAQAISVVGDLWCLDNHRVLCSDSTDPEATARLFDGSKPDLCLTDPPYGINIVKPLRDSDRGVVGGAKPYGSSEGVVVGGGSGDKMYPFGGVKKGVVGGKGIVKPKLYATVMNDETTNTAQEFYNCAIASGVENFIIFGGNYFTTFLPPSPCWVIWDKQNSGNFADVEMAWTPFDRGAKLYAFMWNGLSRAGDRKTELATRVHPTQKPVGLFTQILADFDGEICYDGFLGSGSTLIACEKANRKCFGMELSPAYVDVICRRFMAFSGKSATLDGDGRTFEQISQQRQALLAVQATPAA